MFSRDQKSLAGQSLWSPHSPRGWSSSTDPELCVFAIKIPLLMTHCQGPRKEMWGEYREVGPASRASLGQDSG